MVTQDLVQLTAILYSYRPRLILTGKYTWILTPLLSTSSFSHLSIPFIFLHHTTFTKLISTRNPHSIYYRYTCKYACLNRNIFIASIRCPNSQTGDIYITTI